MVGDLAIALPLQDAHFAELPQDDVKWCAVSLSDVVNAGKRLEASVFDVESKQAYADINACSFPKIPLFSDSGNGFVSRAYYGNRLKRNYIDAERENAIGFIGSSEMLDIKPCPVKFMDKTLDSIKGLHVREGMVLLSRSGTIGNVTYVNKTLSKLLVSEHAIRLECNCDPGYVYCFLKTKTGQALIRSKTYGAVIRQIEPEHLMNIPVPNPPNNIKGKINSLIIRSYDLRDQSNELIDKATNILIKTLCFPSINEFKTERFVNCTDVNSYEVRLSELDRRLDCSYHVPIVKAIVHHLQKHAGELSTVGDRRISKEIILPGRFKRVYVGEGQGRVFFGGKQLYELDPSNKKYLSLTHHGDRIREQLELHENMTLITCSGTIGKVTLVPRHWEHWAANQHIIRVVPASAKIAGYISIFLASDYGHELITRFTYGSVVDEIDDYHVSRIPFPFLRDESAQNEINRIALEANELRYQAYKLEQEAMRIMKTEVIFT